MDAVTKLRDESLRSKVIEWVDAGVVRRAIDLNPVGPIDSADVWTLRTVRECARHLDPPALLARHRADFVGDFGQVLVLAEHERDVVFLAMRLANDIDRNPHVDALFLAIPVGVRVSAGQAYGSIAVPQGTVYVLIPPRAIDSSFFDQNAFQRASSVTAGMPV